jgi:hypothetical protein
MGRNKIQEVITRLCNLPFNLVVSKRKGSMKKIAVILIAAVVFISCKKNIDARPASMVDGILTGFDLGMCPCCGGTFIKIGDTTYRINSIPSSSGIDFEHNPFPINVELTYTMDTTASACRGMYIKSDDIRRR